MKPKSPLFSSPGNFQKALLGWYQKKQRPLPWRKTKDPYRIWISEVMLQQTQVKKVLEYYDPFLKSFPNIKALAQATLQEVLKAWEGLGYYARARNLYRAAQWVTKEGKGQIPQDYEAFHQLPGVGDYIAADVLSIAFGKPYAVIDGNVKRVLARLLLINAPVNQSSLRNRFQKEASRLLDPKNPGDYNQALMELGALICRPQRPICPECPLTHFCQAFQNQLVEKFPLRLEAKKIPTYHIVTGVIEKRGQVLITQRNPAGLLGGLWEFPGGKIKDSESPEQALIREILEEVNLKIKITSFLTQVKHAYTHFKIVMDVFRCQYVSGKVILNGPVGYQWIELKQIDLFPFPKANHKFIPLLKSQALF